MSSSNGGGRKRQQRSRKTKRIRGTRTLRRTGRGTFKARRKGKSR